MFDWALISMVTEMLFHLLGPEETLYPSVVGSSRLTGCAALERTALVLFPEKEQKLYRGRKKKNKPD